jgi:hypothetical protein
MSKPVLGLSPELRHLSRHRAIRRNVRALQIHRQYILFNRPLWPQTGEIQ